MSTRVLIADDSEFDRTLLREILASEYEVVGEAENGVEAVELYGQADPDLVVMDVAMPIRDGIEATAEITDRDADARVIMCTSAGQEAKIEAAVEAGAAEYVIKPFQKPNLLAAVADAVSAA